MLKDAVNLEAILKELTNRLIEMVNDSCWNIISQNYTYILEEINDKCELDINNQRKHVSSLNQRQDPMPLSIAVEKMKFFNDDLYDVNLHVHSSKRSITIIKIKYYLKSNLEPNYRAKVEKDASMFHAKVSIPSYHTKSKKFDVNWELGGIRHEWNSLIGLIRFHLRKK